jgi:hypothetical protein
MKLVKDIKNYNCKICGRKVSNLVGLSHHLACMHRIRSIEYFYEYDPDNLNYSSCIVCNGKRSLENLLRKSNSSVCSKECDYILKRDNTLKNNGPDHYKKLSALARSKIDSTSFSIWQKGYWLKKGLSEDQAVKKVSEINKKNSPLSLEYYKDKNITEEEAKGMISFIQKNRSPRSIYYWMHKKLNLQEALKAVSDYQDVCSLEKFIERDGLEKGKEAYNNYVTKLSNNTCFSYRYWLGKGFSIEESICKVSEIESKAHRSIRVLRKFEGSLKCILHKAGENFEYQKSMPINGNYGGKNRFCIIMDYFLPKYNLNIEMDGDFWHSKESDKDAIRDNFLTINGIKVFRIRQSNWDSLSAIERESFIKEKLCELSL